MGVGVGFKVEAGTESQSAGWWAKSDYRVARLQLRMIDILKPCPPDNKGPGI